MVVRFANVIVASQSLTRFRRRFRCRTLGMLTGVGSLRERVTAQSMSGPGSAAAAAYSSRKSNTSHVGSRQPRTSSPEHTKRPRAGTGATRRRRTPASHQLVGGTRSLRDGLRRPPCSLSRRHRFEGGSLAPTLRSLIAPATVALAQYRSAIAAVANTGEAPLEALSRPRGGSTDAHHRAILNSTGHSTPNINARGRSGTVSKSQRARDP
jgi:hypothetical protein